MTPDAAYEERDIQIAQRRKEEENFHEYQLRAIRYINAAIVYRIGKKQ